MRMKNSAKIILLIFGTAFFSAVWKIMTSQLSIEPLRENGIEEDRKELDEWTKKWRMKSCSCAACVSECNTSLMMRYNSTVHPFLTQLENITLEVFSWWKQLQRETGSFSKFLEIKERIFTVFPSKPDLVEAGVDRCRTCAVVGNSGNLKGSKYGSRIDAHDTIIRMNVGVTAGFEEDVGTRTTHRIMYPESAISLDNSTHLVLLPFKIMDLQWIIDAVGAGFHDRSYAPVIPNINVNKSLVMIINPAFMKYVHTSWLSSRGHYPSTGFMTLILAMHICDEVKIFGFGADKNGNWNHYWEELKNKKLKTGIHPGTDEYDVIQNLAKQKKITFYRGW